MQRNAKLSIIGSKPQSSGSPASDSLEGSRGHPSELNVPAQAAEEIVTIPGLESPKVIDIITPNRSENAVELWLVQTKSWSDYPAGLFLKQLEDKFNNYLDYCLDGFLFQHYPQYRSMTPKLVLVHFETLPEPVARMAAAFTNFIGQHSLKFEVRIAENDTCLTFATRAQNMGATTD